jgi:hypothetical protein
MLGQNHFSQAKKKPACFDFSSSKICCTGALVKLHLEIIFSLNLMFIAHVYKWPAIVVVCVRCCNRLSVRYISYVYIVNYMWLDSLYMSLCGVILFVGWFCLVEPTIIIPPPLSLSYAPLLFGLYSSFSHRDKDGYDFWTISEASLTPIYTIAFISRSSFWHLVPHINYLFKRNQALFHIKYSLISRPLHMQIISAVPNTNSSLNT